MLSDKGSEAQDVAQVANAPSWGLSQQWQRSFFLKTNIETWKYFATGIKNS